MIKKLILVLNCGSSSIKFSIINPITFIVLIHGVVETIDNFTFIKIQDLINKKKYLNQLNKITIYEQLITMIFDTLSKKYTNYFDSIIGIGHRVVHGGKYAKKSMIINRDVLLKIKKASIFAPLHNPFHLLAIKSSLKRMSHLRHSNVAVFDTSFHQTLPKESFLYAIPYYFYKNYSIRKYGAHGINHLYVTQQCANFLKKSVDQLNIISCHLGSGSSVTAVVNGKSIDTSMGLTPLEGLAMGTRCGDIDPYIIFYMINKLKISVDEVQKILTNNSGMLGISSISSDFRELEQKYNTHKRAKLSIDIFCNRVSKYISGYSSLMHGRLDAVIFTGGVGENSSFIRKNIIQKLSLLNLFIDEQKNLKENTRNRCIHAKNSSTILVIPANENQIIAQESYRLLEKKNLYV